MFWYGDRNKGHQDLPFIFHNNIIYGCNHFWNTVKTIDIPFYDFRNSLISNNEYSLGIEDKDGYMIPFSGKEQYKESGLIKTSEVKLREMKTDGVLLDYLNLLPGSQGDELKAGIRK